MLTKSRQIFVCLQNIISNYQCHHGCSIVKGRIKLWGARFDSLLCGVPGIWGRSWVCRSPGTWRAQRRRGPRLRRTGSLRGAAQQTGSCRVKWSLVSWEKSINYTFEKTKLYVKTCLSSLWIPTQKYVCFLFYILYCSIFIFISSLLKLESFDIYWAFGFVKLFRFLSL